MYIRRLSPAVVSSLRTDVTVSSTSQCVSELVLNAIDAGATVVAVRVDLRNFKLQVADNGRGITSTDLNTIGSRYMTSKCHSLDDLGKNLIYYGFRGEALCSIIEISGTVRIVSRAEGSENSFCKVFSQGVALCVGKSSTPLASCGTSITIGDFLYNRPVRRTRIKPVLDLEEIKKHIESIALINPHVSFSLRDDVTNELMMQSFQTGDVRKTFGALFGEDLSQSLVSIEQRFASFTLNGYISRQAHPLKNFQYVYLNKRLLLRTKLHKLINSIMSRSAIMKTNNVPYVPISKEINHGVFLAFSPPKRDKHAVFILNISCSHSEYDITQDPRKTLVEFSDWDGVLSCIEKGLRCFIEKESKGAEEGGVHDGLGVSKKGSSVIDEINNLDRECAFGFDSSVTTVGEIGLEVVQGLPATRNVVDFSSKTASDVLLSSNIGLHSDTAFLCTKTSFLSNSVSTERPYSTNWKERSSHSMKSLDSPGSATLTDTFLSSVHTSQTKSNNSEFPKELSVESLREGFAKNRLYFEENFRRLTQTSKMFEEESKSGTPQTSVNAMASIKEIKRKKFLRNLEKFSYDGALKKPQLCNSKIVKGSKQDNLSVLKNRSRGCNTPAASQTIVSSGKRTTEHLNSSLATCKIKNLTLPKPTLAQKCPFIQSGMDSPNLEPFKIQGNRLLTKNICATSSLFVGCSEKESSDSGADFEDLNLGTSMEVAFSEDLGSTSEFTCNNKDIDIYASSLICHSNARALSFKNGPSDFVVACKETEDPLTSKKMSSLPVLTQETLLEDIFRETLEEEESSSVTCNYVSNNRNIFCVDNFIKDLTVILPDKRGHNDVVMNQTFNECFSEAHYTDSDVCSGENDTSSFQDPRLHGSSKGGQCDESAFNLSEKSPQVRLVDYSSSSASFSPDCDALSYLPGEDIQNEIKGKREQNFQSFETHVSKKLCLSLPDLPLQTDNSISTTTEKTVKNSHSDKSSETDTFDCFKAAKGLSENISRGDIELQILSANPNQKALKFSETQEISLKLFCNSDLKENTNDIRSEVHSESSTCQDPFKETSQLQKSNHNELTSRLLSEQQETATHLNNKLTPCTDFTFVADLGDSVSVTDAINITKVSDHESPALSQDNFSDGNDWAQEKDSAGKPFYVHKKSGITVYNKPQADVVGTFTLNDRFSFLPKGMSPIVQDKTCNKQHKEDDLSSEKRKELLSMASISCNREELSTVKWKTQNSDCKDKSWPLLDQLMSDIGSSEKFVIESQVSSVAVQDLSQPDIQVYNVLYPYTFSKDIFKNLKVIGQLDKKFIVTVVNTDAAKQVLVLFDQHAVHERVRVENLTKEYQQHDGHAIWHSAPVEPALPLVLSSIEVRILSSYQEKMNQLGLHFDVLDSNTISIQRVPTCLLLRETREVQTRRTSVLRQHLESLVREEVDSLLNTRGVGTSHPTIISSVISSEACRGAIKFGDPLSLADCQALLHNLSSCCLPFQCAHGRPALVPILDVSKLKKPSSVSKPVLQNLKKHLNSSN